MPFERKTLGKYSAQDGWIHSELGIDVDTYEGRINPENSNYYVKLNFWRADTGESADLNYVVRGFKNVFARVKPAIPGIAKVLAENDVQQIVASPSLDICVAQFEKETAAIGLLKEYPHIVAQH